MYVADGTVDVDPFGDELDVEVPPVSTAQLDIEDHLRGEPG